MEQNTINIIAGGFSGFTQVVVGFPFDTLKIKKQTLNKKVFTYKTIYRGVRFPLITILPITTIQFSLEDYLKTIIDNRFVTGALTGMATSPLVSITDLLRIREQQNTQVPLDITRGQAITMIRETISLSIYFGTYSTIKTHLKKKDYGDISSILVAGSVCGCLSWTLTYPLDIAKSRLQSYNVGSVVDAIKKGKLGGGLLICNVRAIIINSIGWLVYEKTKQFIGGG